MTTGTFSQNVGKLFYELKLVTNNLLSIGKIMGRKKLAYKDTEPGLRATILKNSHYVNHIVIMGRKKLAYKDTEPGLRATILKIPIM